MTKCHGRLTARSAIRCSLAGVALVVSLAGCSSTQGPDLVIGSHLDYNRAVSQVIHEEVLLNIVRRRYLEAIKLVSIDSISTNISNSVGADAGAAYTGASGSNRSYDLSTGLSGSFEDSPTVTISPLSGAEVAKALHDSMPVDTIGRMANAGYRFDLLLILLVQNVNGVRGIDGGIGAEFQGSSPEFTEMLGIVNDLMNKNELVVGSFRWEDSYGDGVPADQITADQWISAVSTSNRWRSYDGNKNYYLTDHAYYTAMALSPEAKASAEGQRLVEMLKIDPDPLRRIWPFNPIRVIWGSDKTSDPDHLAYDLRARMRSFYGVLNFLANGVEVPPNDQQATFPIDAYRAEVEGKPLEDITARFQIRWSQEKPEAPFVTVQHRGVWFYIDDTDLRSKHIFNALIDLYELQVSPSGSSSSPVLTLPVAG